MKVLASQAFFICFTAIYIEGLVKLSQPRGVFLSGVLWNASQSVVSPSQQNVTLEIAEGESVLRELVASLLRVNVSQHLYVVYDSPDNDVDALLAMGSTIGWDTTIFLYEDFLHSLKYMTWLAEHVKDVRQVLVLCSEANVIRLFENVRDQNLENPSMKWFVVSSHQIYDQLELILREGTQVVVAERQYPGAYQLRASRMSVADRVTLPVIGRWRLDNGRVRVHLKEELFPPLDVLYRDFGGRELISAVNDNWPFFKVKTFKNGTIVPDVGIDVNILQSIARVLNFTIRMVSPADGQWGSPLEDGTIPGIIGMLSRHEAHISICEFTITNRRDTVVDFSYPYFIESTTLVSRAPKPRSRTFAVLWPFTLQVWILLLLMQLLVGPLCFCLTWFEARLLPSAKPYALSELSFSTFRTMMIQGSLIKIPGTPLRITIAAWYLFCFIVYALYAGTLTAFLAIPDFEKPIDSLEDFLTAIRSKGFYLSALPQSSNEGIFKFATEGIAKQIWEEGFLPGLSHPSSVTDGLEGVLEKDAVYIHAKLSMTIRTARRGSSKYHLARESFYPQGYGIVLRNGSPFTTVFNKLLGRITQNGLVTKWAKDEVNRFRGAGDTGGDQGAEDRPDGVMTSAIALTHVQAAFYLLAMGWGIAAMVFFVEIAYSYCRSTWSN